MHPPGEGGGTGCWGSQGPFGFEEWWQSWQWSLLDGWRFTVVWRFCWQWPVLEVVESKGFQFKNQKHDLPCHVSSNKHYAHVLAEKLPTDHVFLIGVSLKLPQTWWIQMCWTKIIGEYKVKGGYTLGCSTTGNSHHQDSLWHLFHLPLSRLRGSL